MLILAVEQSSVESSAVICDDCEVLASVSWKESRLRSQRFFPSVERILRQSGHQVKDIEVFCAGTGPGSFNALRMCVSALQAFALPEKNTLYGVASPQALALQIHKQKGVSRISIVGDARRGSLWVANYTFSKSSLPSESSINLFRPEELASATATAESIVSADFDRISAVLSGIPGSPNRLLQEPAYPTAEFVAETACYGLLTGTPSTIFAPTYLHPAV